MGVQDCNLDDLVARDSLRCLVTTYSRAVDRRDFKPLRSLYHDDADDHHGDMFRGGADAYVAFVEQALLPRLAAEDLAPVAGHLLEGVVEDGAHRVLVDLLVSEAHDWLVENESAVQRIVRDRAPWWSPSWLDDRVVDRVIHRAPGRATMTP